MGNGRLNLRDHLSSCSRLMYAFPSQRPRHAQFSYACFRSVLYSALLRHTLFSLNHHCPLVLFTDLDHILQVVKRQYDYPWSYVSFPWLVLICYIKHLKSLLQCSFGRSAAMLKTIYARISPLPITARNIPHNVRIASMTDFRGVFRVMFMIPAQ